MSPRSALVNEELRRRSKERLLHAAVELVDEHGYEATTLGDITEEVLSDNDSAWSADHCIAADEVPGVIFSNRRIVRENPSLVDLAPTILEEFGVAKPATMTGGNLFK